MRVLCFIKAYLTQMLINIFDIIEKFWRSVHFKVDGL